MMPRMKNRVARLVVVPLVLVASAAALTACKAEVNVGGETTVNSSDLEQQLATKFAPKLDQKASGVSVDCPDDQSAEKGTKFTCTLTEPNDSTVDIEVTLTDDSGSYDAAVVGTDGKS